MRSETSPIVVIAGNIATGKSTAAIAIAENFGWDYHAEPDETDEVLRDFYMDMHRWTFTLNMHLLGVRAAQLASVTSRTRGVVIDRSIYEDALFVDLARTLGTTTDRNVTIFSRLFSVLTETLPRPDLLVYLHGHLPNLADRARRRGRPFVPEVDVRYLEALQERYDEWIESYDLSPVVDVDVESLDLRKPEGQSQLVSAVGSALPQPPR